MDTQKFTCAAEGCEEPLQAFPRRCPGDGAYHHHGCVHTVPGSAITYKGNQWGWLCDHHTVVCEREWETLSSCRRILGATA